VVDGRTVAEWIAWARERIDAADPLARPPAELFAEVAAVTAWTYTDDR
jgi:hypothetical protein